MKVLTKVKIIKASKNTYWYAERIGDVFEVYPWFHEIHPDFGYEVTEEKNRLINKEDCEIVKDIPEFDMKKEKWFISTPTPEISKLVQEWLFDQGMTWCSGDKHVDVCATGQPILSNIAEWTTEGVNLNGFMFCQDAPDDSYEVKLSFKTIIDSVEYPIVETEQQKQIRELEETIAKAAEQIKQLKGI